MVVKIVPNDTANPPGKLAVAELHFTDGVLDGLKLIGFAVWERRSGSGRNVTFPARQYTVNGDRRSFALVWILLACAIAGLAAFGSSWSGASPRPIESRSQMRRAASRPSASALVRPSWNSLRTGR